METIERERADIRQSNAEAARARDVAKDAAAMGAIAMERQVPEKLQWTVKLFAAAANGVVNAVYNDIPVANATRDSELANRRVAIKRKVLEDVHSKHGQSIAESGVTMAHQVQRSLDAQIQAMETHGFLERRPR